MKLSYLKNLFLRTVTIFSIIYGLLCGYLYSVQEQLLFFPTQEAFADCELAENIKVENKFRVHVVKGESLIERNLVFFNGNAGSACDRLPLAENFKKNFSKIIFFEYPGYADDNEGPTQSRILKSVDDFLSWDQLKVDSVPLTLTGESLGTGVAIYASTKVKVANVILFSPYTSIADVATLHYKVFPAFLIKHPFPADEWAPKSLAEKVLIYHGEQDDIIPISLGVALLKQFKVPVEFLRLPETGHNDLLYRKPHIWNTINDFLNR